MLHFIKKHPLLFCMIVALALRLCSVVFSKGFMANDDHFETIQVSYNAVQTSLLSEEGCINWNAMKGTDVGRSPLYTLFNYSIMTVLTWLGMYDLDPMMYFIRLIHALLSLLLVYYGFKYVHLATGNKNYSLITGLILAAHFLMPYIGVRNLVEVVSADLLMPCVYFAYRGVREENNRLLMLAGILGSLSWLIRFNTGLAVIPIPFAIWYLTGRIRPALYFCTGCMLIAVFGASLDAVYLGTFGRSTYNIFNSFLYVTKSPPLPQPIYMFAGLILGIFIPPFSLFFIFSIFRKKIISSHLILFSSAAAFFIIHSFIRHKEERFMIPIFPLLVVLGMLGLYFWLKNSNPKSLMRRIFKYSAVFAVILNLIVLPLFTFNYAHKGMVEPFVYLSRQDDVEMVVIDRTERRRFLAVSYAGYTKPDYFKVDKWEELAALDPHSPVFNRANYFIIFSDEHADRHADSLTGYFGEISPVFHSTPSLMDAILHFMNPKYNHLSEAWVYKRNIKNPLPVDGG
ncbi:MAG: hypothetical protein DRP46_03985 [Candidatus Zixiibacteriota bacterium]|nr:MAG: hypothetical protein DRP46_03985 [candidate division Zixibacteria bacterium]